MYSFSVNIVVFIGHLEAHVETRDPLYMPCQLAPLEEFMRLLVEWEILGVLLNV